LFANDTNRVRRAVLCLSQDGVCTNLFENFSKNNLKEDLSQDTTDNPPLFSLVNTFNSTVMVSTPIKINKEQQKKIFHFSRVVPKQMRRQGTFGGEPNKSRRPINKTFNRNKIFLVYQ
jgi:hypothetical protein